MKKYTMTKYNVNDEMKTVTEMTDEELDEFELDSDLWKELWSNDNDRALTFYSEVIAFRNGEFADDVYENIVMGVYRANTRKEIEIEECIEFFVYDYNEELAYGLRFARYGEDLEADYSGYEEFTKGWMGTYDRDCCYNGCWF